MRRYIFWVLMLLLSLIPIKAEVRGVSSFSSSVSSLQKGLTLMSYDIPLEVRRGGGKALEKLIIGIIAEIRNPTLKGIVEYILYGFLFLILIFFTKDED